MVAVLTCRRDRAPVRVTYPAPMRSPSPIMCTFALNERQVRERCALVAVLHGCYGDAVNVRPREVADHAAVQAFLARHNSVRAARLGELVHPLDHPAFVA